MSKKNTEEIENFNQNSTISDNEIITKLDETIEDKEIIENNESEKSLTELFVIKDLDTNFFIKLSNNNITRTNIIVCDKYNTYDEALNIIKENIEILKYVTIVKTYK